MDPTIISTSVAYMKEIVSAVHMQELPRLTGTLYSSVSPRPVRPTEPNDMLSSKINRYLYFFFSSICSITLSIREYEI